MNSKDYIKLAQLCAAMQEQSNKKHAIIHEILQREGDINFKIPAQSYVKQYGDDYRSYAALRWALDSREIDVFNTLLAHGADFSLKNEKGETILHQALANSYMQFANCWKIKGRLEHPFIDSILLAHVNANNCDNSRNEYGISYFHAACMTNNVKAVEFYLNRGVLVNEAVNADSSVLAGYTGLHLAARYCCLEIAKLLLSSGADPQLKDNKGLTPLHMLIERNMQIVDWMNTSKRACYDQFIADFEDNEQMIELIMSRNYSSWKCLDGIGLSRFHVACTIYDQSKIEQYLGELIDLTRSIKANSPIWPGYTALHFAAHFNVETVKLLVKNGANLLAKDARNITPFDLCLQRYEAEHIHFLITNQPSWKYILLSDNKTRLSDLVFAMRSAMELNFYLDNIAHVNTFVSMNSPLWPGCTPLHLAVILPERNRDIQDLLASTEYNPHEEADKRYYNCSQTKEKLYLLRIKVCLQFNADVTAQDVRNSTPLHQAFRLQRESAVNELLRNLREIRNYYDDDGLTYLHIACATQRRDIIDKLLDRRNVNEPVPASCKWFIKPYYWDSSTYAFHISAESTLLHIAVTCENADLVEMLLKHGADVYAKDVNGLTPIHRVFVIRSRSSIALNLFSTNPLRNCVIEGGLSHLHVASLMANRESVKKLIDNGANINGVVNHKSSVRNNDDGTLLSGNPAFDLYDDTSSDPMRFLSLYDGQTPLHFAMDNHQDPDVAKLLLEHGADVLAKKPDGSTPLYSVLADNRHHSLTDFFVSMLKKDSTLQERILKDAGITMLHVACATLDVDFVKELLACGANVNARTHDDSHIWPGCSPLHMLMTPLSEDERDKIGAVINLLLQHDADVTSINVKQSSPIHKLYSLIEPYVENHLHVDALLTAQKDYSINPINSKGLSHFHVACARNQVAIVEEFLKHGIDINQAIDHFCISFGGYTTLHIAVFKDSRETIDLLLRHGANVNAEDRYGNTPLHVTAERDDISRRLIEQIINGGANIHAKNLLGKTVFEVLMTKWTDVSAPVLELFLKHGWQVNTFNPFSEEGTIAMAFSTSNENIRGVEKPAFQALMKAPDIAVVDEIGRNSIHNIVSMQQPQHNNSADDYADAIEILVRLGCDYDHQDTLGRTPLHLAVEFRQIEAITGLLQSGADVNITDTKGNPAFSYILKYLHKHLEHDRQIVNRLSVYLLKMVRLGLDVNRINVEAIVASRKSIPFKITVDKAFEEQLEKVKERKISSTNIRLHDFLSETGAVSSYPYTTPQERYAIKNFFENDFEALRKEFPEVAGFLRLQYKKARARLALINPAIASLGIVIGFELPVLCFDVVLKFLRNEDLRNLIAAADHMIWITEDNKMSTQNGESKSLKNYTRLAQFYGAISALSLKKFTIIEGILQRDGDINYKISSNSFVKYRRPHLLGYTALHFTLDEGEVKIFDFLIKRGADFTIKNDNGATVLHQAFENSYNRSKRCWKLKGKQNHPFVNLVLSAHVEYKISANPCNKNGISHFHIACMVNHDKAVEFFLNNGASVNETVHRNSLALPGYTPLHFAARYCALKTAELLLRYGANPELRDAQEMSPLHILIDRNMEIVDWMKTSLRENFGQLALDLEDNEKMINLLFSNCNDSDVVENTGLSRLQIACTLQDTSLAEQLIQRDVDLEHFVNTDSALWPGYTALHFAAHFNFKTVRILVNEGANILAQDSKGVTPFDLCLQRYKAEEIYFLVMRQPLWRNVTFSDGTTRLTNIILAMRYSCTFYTFLQQIDGNINMCIPFDSPIWPGYTPLHLAIIFPERINNMNDLIEDTDYFGTKKVTPAFYNCSFDDERVYLERVKVCLSLGADVTAQDARGLTPIHLAFRLQKENVAQLLLQFHQKIVNPVDDDGLSHFHIACATRNLHLVDILLRSGVDVNSPVMSSFKWFGMPYYRETRPYVFYISTGSTPLHIAAAGESPELTDMLVKNGADIYATDVNGLTPIHRVLTTRGYKETGSYLTSAIDLKDCTVRGGLSHLHIACLVNNVAAVMSLLDHGSNIESTVTYRLPIEYGRGQAPELRDVFVDPYDDRSLEPLSFLAPYSGYTPLHFAMQEHCKDVIKCLIERGADVLAKKANGMAPLYATLDCSYAYMASVFAQVLRSDVRIQKRMEDDIGLTMLHLDCVSLNIEGVRERLNAGVDANSQVKAESSVWPGCTSLHVLMSRSHDERNSRSTLEIIKLLLQHGADVTLMNEKCVTPVHEAYTLFHLNAHPYVDILLEGQRDYSVNPYSVDGISHFHVACRRNKVKIIKKFLNHGVDVNDAIDHFSNDHGGYSALHLAMVHDAKETVDLLLSHGADVLVEDYLGNTPLHAAAEHSSSSKNLIEKIISAGADIHAKNVLGETPLELLLNSSDAPASVIELFLKRGCKVNVFNPISQEGYIAMAFNTVNQRSSAIQRPGFRAALSAPDVKNLDTMGRNAVHNIVSTFKKNNSAADYADGIEILTRMNCDVDHQDNQGRTPLHLAAQLRNFQAIAGLLMCGADVNILDANDKPAFAYSLEHSERGRERDLHIIVTFSMHLRKLQLLELDVHQLNIEVDIEARKRFPFDVKVAERCQDELEKLKERTIDPYSVTLFDFLSETGAVAAYPHMPQIQRHAIDEFFYNDSVGLCKQFPELACLLKLQYRRAVARMPLMEPATMALSIVLGFELPLLCSDAIVRFMKNEELRKLIAASEEQCDTRKRLKT
ncbi:uncharacterized protein LOC131669048 [Phymastichus coffea]|uniref:uncharacterized protein LOC131669048 n=1 Tax=Phymastichus coffea TaxID=108790 RepID=UPI00273AC4F4|nr:uncharacterized protein LOC131669048 [Phymastichus coffea]